MIHECQFERLICCRTSKKRTKTITPSSMQLGEITRFKLQIFVLSSFTTARIILIFYASYGAKITQELCPPKPNELLMAAVTLCSFLTFAQVSIPATTSSHSF